MDPVIGKVKVIVLPEWHNNTLSDNTKDYILHVSRSSDLVPAAEITLFQCSYCDKTGHVLSNQKFLAYGKMMIKKENSNY